MPHRHRRRRRLEELYIERRSTRPRRQHLQGPGHQRRARHPGRVHRLRPRATTASSTSPTCTRATSPARRTTPPSAWARRCPAATARRSRPCLRRGDEVIVQILKEGIGTKGPTLTSYLSIPGRFLVMMPGWARSASRRKVEDEDERRAMREDPRPARACPRASASSSAPPAWTAPRPRSSATSRTSRACGRTWRSA